jgi:hypothetical protein
MQPSQQASHARAETVASTCADGAMQDVYDAAYVTLHVRVSNQAACHLYKKTLGYECAACPYSEHSWHMSSPTPQ